MKIDFAGAKDRIKNFSLNNRLYDFIIIGSGPAAVTLYKKIISKKNKSKILILEEGDFSKKNFKKVFSKHLKINLLLQTITIKLSVL